MTIRPNEISLPNKAQNIKFFWWCHFALNAMVGALSSLASYPSLSVQTKNFTTLAEMFSKLNFLVLICTAHQIEMALRALKAKNQFRIIHPLIPAFLSLIPVLDFLIPILVWRKIKKHIGDTPKI